MPAAHAVAVSPLENHMLDALVIAPHPDDAELGMGGTIALMLAQRFPEAQVTALEIDPEAAAQATENFKESPLLQ